MSPSPKSRASRLTGRGRGGEEDGSKGGSRDADRLVAAETARDMAFGLGGDESIVEGGYLV